MNTRALAFAVVASLGLPAAAQDRLAFDVAPGTKLLKTYRASHELRIDDMGELLDDLPFVSNRTGGWISSWQRVEYLDDYQEVGGGRPLVFTRTIRDGTASGSGVATRANGVRQDDSSRSASPLRQQTVRFQWVPEERDWSRCYERIDAEEDWLGALHGEFELLPLLPAGPVSTGDTWNVDLAHVRDVFAPGGDLKLTPAGSNMFGRTMELGIGGDFADFMGADVGGEVKATYQGRRSVPREEGGTEQLECGVVALEINLSLQSDRTQLYRTAMPAEERREAARLDSVTLEYTLLGRGELLWDLAGGHFHALTIEGQQGFVATIWKTRFDGREQHKSGQQSRYSGPLVLEAVCEDGSNVDPVKPRDNPKLRPKRK